MSKEIDFNNLTYYFKDQNITPIHFISFKAPLHMYNKIKNSNIFNRKNRSRSKTF